LNGTRISTKNVYFCRGPSSMKRLGCNNHVISLDLKYYISRRFIGVAFELDVGETKYKFEMISTFSDSCDSSVSRAQLRSIRPTGELDTFPQCDSWQYTKGRTLGSSLLIVSRSIPRHFQKRPRRTQIGSHRGYRTIEGIVVLNGAYSHDHR
jgi:hypothetical protein